VHIFKQPLKEKALEDALEKRENIRQLIQIGYNLSGINMNVLKWSCNATRSDHRYCILEQEDLDVWKYFLILCSQLSVGGY
jgi:hypothetical protein